ncbi:50S ribosomal protein L1 [Candidatus Falkowbacteria bacterium]|jgi:large subunit ribosomal protein L1|nr:50S ribosomal protein L1 [Candidatus Falkowbacteria bacterium]MBT7007662.1 50S ribosomal protein L1 [Candidatus Falkowbacteria bacterium]
MTKRINKLKTFIDQKKVYPIAEAIELVKKTGKKKFDETVELHARLGIDPKKGDQQVRGTVVLPHSFGKSKVVAAFVPQEQEKEAKEAGADVIYTEDNLKEFQKSGKINFEIAVSVPKMMKNLAPLAKTLGPKGLMPSPKNETITQDLKKTISELKKGKIAFKNDDSANIHQGLGKVSTEDKALIENFETFIKALSDSKPESSKGVFIKGITICSTMGPGVKVEV